MTNAEVFIGDEELIDTFIEEFCDFAYERDVEFKYLYLKETLEAFFKKERKPKPELAEDERVILNFIKNFDYIGRDEKGLYYKLQDEDVKEKTAVIYNHTTNLFKFIKEGEEYEIEELLK